MPISVVMHEQQKVYKIGQQIINCLSLDLSLAACPSVSVHCRLRSRPLGFCLVESGQAGSQAGRQAGRPISTHTHTHKHTHLEFQLAQGTGIELEAVPTVDTCLLPQYCPTTPSPQGPQGPLGGGSGGKPANPPPPPPQPTHPSTPTRVRGLKYKRPTRVHCVNPSPSAAVVVVVVHCVKSVLKPPEQGFLGEFSTPSSRQPTNITSLPRSTV